MTALVSVAFAAAYPIVAALHAAGAPFEDITAVYDDAARMRHHLERHHS